MPRYSWLSSLDHRPVLKISHASVFVPGRLFFSPCVEDDIPQELCSLPLRKADTEKRSQLENDPSLTLPMCCLDITSIFWNTLGRNQGGILGNYEEQR